VAASDPTFVRLVSLACHDLRTPLATVQGFAKTLLRMDVTPEQRERYLGLIDAASSELAELTDRLALVARIEGGRYEPVLREADSLELARAADERAEGTGAAVRVDPEVVTRALADLVRAAERHGDVQVSVRVEGPRVELAPVDEVAGPVVLGRDQKDLGAAVAVRLLDAIGGAVALADGTLVVTLPAAEET
jgi:signal transduction histidine kinase